jgi:effector-binding domain-containing protein
VLKGSFEGLGAAWQSLFEQCAAQNLKLAGINWEIYRGEGADPSQQESALYALLA